VEWGLLCSVKNIILFIYCYSITSIVDFNFFNALHCICTLIFELNKSNYYWWSSILIRHVFWQYHVNIIGKMGESNGEYPIQEVFGWTNGIVLEFLQKYNSINITTTCIDTLTIEERCRLKMSYGNIFTSFFNNEKKNK